MGVVNESVCFLRHISQCLPVGPVDVIGRSVPQCLMQSLTVVELHPATDDLQTKPPSGRSRRTGVHGNLY